MLFDLKNPVTDITGVDRLKWAQTNCNVLPREYSALCFRISGAGIINCGGKVHNVSANDILYMPQNVGYSAEYTETEVVVIHFKTQMDDNFARVFSLPNTDKIYKLFLQALNIWQNKTAGYKTFVAAILYEILGIIYAQTPQYSVPSNFLAAVSVINSDFTDNLLSVKQICSKAKISETYFRRLFSQYYKKTPISYINELRMEYARNLIASGVTVEKAAFKSGFNDSKYFSRAIKKHFGCTPRQLKIYGK